MPFEKSGMTKPKKFFQYNESEEIMDREMIEKLQENREPFGLMAKDMQEAAVEIGIVKFDYYAGQNSGNWDTDSKDDFFRHYRTYRLCPGYQHEPEVNECEVWPDDDGDLGYLPAGKTDYKDWSYLEEAVHDPNFIGAKDKDGCIHIGFRWKVEGQAALGIPVAVLFAVDSRKADE